MDQQEASERQAVVAEAKTWLGTPFHDCASIKGRAGGVDCAMFVKCVFENCRLVPPIQIPNYSPQWFLHHDAEEYMTRVLKHAKEVATPQTGDVVLYRLLIRRAVAGGLGEMKGRCFSHGAIVDAWPERVIHAFKDLRGVVETGGFDGQLAGAEVKFFSRW
jgi:cell wall-associated NlpC family hydrolase